MVEHGLGKVVIPYLCGSVIWNGFSFPGNSSWPFLKPGSLSIASSMLAGAAASSAAIGTKPPVNFLDSGFGSAGALLSWAELSWP